MIYTSLILGTIFYILSIILHLLVILKKISFNHVNGGRSQSYEAQKNTSIFSIIVLIFGLLYLISNALFNQFSESLANKIILIVISIYWILGYIMQMFGTKFEKKYVSWILLLGVFAHILLFVSYMSS